MAHEDGAEGGVLEDVHFEGENDHEGVEDGGHLGNAGAVPSPDLRGDVVVDGNGEGVGGLGEAEVEAGVVDEEEGVGPAGAEDAGEFAEEAQEEGQAGEDVPEAEDGHVAAIMEEVDAFAAHGVAADAEEGDVGAKGAEVADEAGGVLVAGGFAGDNHDAEGSGHQVWPFSRMERTMATASLRASAACWPSTTGAEWLRTQSTKERSSRARGSPLWMGMSFFSMPRNFLRRTFPVCSW